MDFLRTNSFLYVGLICDLMPINISTSLTRIAPALCVITAKSRKMCTAILQHHELNRHVT